MFRTFRNKVFAIYVLSISILLVGSLTFVYVRSYNEMEASITQRLSDDKGHQERPNQPDVESEPLAVDKVNIDDARDITLAADADLEQQLANYLGTDFVIDYQSQLITSGSETYMYNQTAGVYKIVKVTYDLQYISNLKTTLIILGLVVVTLFSIIGFILINKLVEPIKQSYQIQNQFVSDASHELKTPLAIIKSCLQLIAKGDEDSANLIDYCQDETDRLIRLTSNLLQLSETDKPSYERINVSEVLELLISGIEVNLFERNIAFESSIAPEVFARVASDDINQLTHILIDNAVKYNDDRAKVLVKLEQSNRSLVLVVINSSDRISAENLEHLFDRFYRVESSRTEKGFGLGLSLAQHLTNKYDGEIRAEYNSGYFSIIVKIPTI